MDAEIALLQFQPYHLRRIGGITTVLRNGQSEAVRLLGKGAIVVLFDRQQGSLADRAAAERCGGYGRQIDCCTLTGPIEEDSVERIVLLRVMHLEAARAFAPKSRFLIFDFDLIQRHKKATKYPAERPRIFRLFLLSLRPKRNAEKP